MPSIIIIPSRWRKNPGAVLPHG